MYNASYFGVSGIQVAVKGGFPGGFVQTLLKVSLEISYGYILLTALPVGKSAGLDIIRSVPGIRTLRFPPVPV